MVAEAYDQHRLIRQFRSDARHEVAIVVRADRLPAQIFVGLQPVAGIAPVFGSEVGPIMVRPGEMIGSVIDQHEQRGSAALPRDQFDGIVVVERVRFDIRRRIIFDVIEMLDAGCGLEAARAQEGAEKRKQAEGAVAAPAQRIRQPPLHPAGGNAREEFGKAAIGARRKAGEHVVFGKNTRAARAFDHQ